MQQLSNQYTAHKKQLDEDRANNAQLIPVEVGLVNYYLPFLSASSECLPYILVCYLCVMRSSSCCCSVIVVVVVVLEVVVEVLEVVVV